MKTRRGSARIRLGLVRGRPAGPHPHGHLVPLLHDLFPDWWFSITPRGRWVARPKDAGRTTLTATSLGDLLSSVYIAEPTAAARIHRHMRHIP
ncbi:hypothetical protein BTM25_02340 [Actinomadura rubteroloni]|uniref:Uncharacterized protein n=1 Tax=Actinomadura rubteroloni TaxID=1926885 RepID=A0A2P4ULD2_9ACTN|nr:hypothetical protein [Actinomadura rubteroloni]POM25851.1 hypothetical protein BTM25_02340 [Actinomadura rubteroloni]